MCVAQAPTHPSNNRSDRLRQFDNLGLPNGGPFYWCAIIGWEKFGSVVPKVRYKQRLKKNLGFFDYSPFVTIVCFIFGKYFLTLMVLISANHPV
jgi:hypothetical protein